MRKLRLEELGRVSVSQYILLPKIPVTVVLDNIRSAMNVGSIFRSCDAFLIEKIVLTGITAQPPHKEIMKTAIGADRSVSWEYQQDIANAIQTLKSKNILVVGIEQTEKSVSIQDFNVEQGTRYALVFGNEVEGISDEILGQLDYAIDIDQFGTKHSLNVGVCAGVVLWYFEQHLKCQK